MIRYEGKDVALFPEIPDIAWMWRNNREIFRWCRQYTLLSKADHEAWLSKIHTDKSIKMFSILEFKDDSSFDVGVCGLTSIDKHNQSAEFSLYIDPSQQKKGLGKAALWTLLKHGFEDMNLNRIWGETFDGNPAIGMFTSLGMKKEGTLRNSYFREGRFIDSHIVSILRGEFK